MFALSKGVPYGSVWEWHGGLGHPILKLFGFLVAILATVVLLVLGVLALIVDIILLPFRLLL